MNGQNMHDAFSLTLAVCPVAPLYDAACFARGLEAVPPWRRDKALRYRQPADRARSLAAGLLLGRVLGLHGLGWEGIEYDAHGKPLCRRWPATLSLTHSGELAACALCSAAPAGNAPDAGEGAAISPALWPPAVGVDVERRTRGVHTAVSARVSTPREQAYMAALADDAARHEAFFVLWSRKESLLKAAGQGLGGDPATVEVLPLTEARVYCAWRGTGWHIRSYPLPDYSLSLCVADNAGTAVLPPAAPQWFSLDDI